MTRQETGIIMDILTAAYPRFYAGPDRPDMRSTVILWAEMFRDEPVELVAAGVKAFIASDNKGFPPHVGAIKNAIHSLSEATELDAAGAWALVRKAASNSAYAAQEEFDKLPDQIKRLVGSPSQLYDWSQMDSDSFNSVVGSNFQRSFRVRQERERMTALLPSDVRKLLGGLSEHLALEAAEGEGQVSLPGF